MSRIFYFIGSRIVPIEIVVFLPTLITQLLKYLKFWLKSQIKIKELVHNPIGAFNFICYSLVFINI